LYLIVKPGPIGHAHSDSFICYYKLKCKWDSKWKWKYAIWSGTFAACERLLHFCNQTTWLTVLRKVCYVSTLSNIKCHIFAAVHSLESGVWCIKVCEAAYW